MFWKARSLPMPFGTAEESRQFADADLLPLLGADTVRTWGRTLAVAPHPDDESLGCGGALALLAQYGLAPQVLFVSDGTGSHPNSALYPAPRLRALRETEAQEALSHLGVPASDAVFLQIQDGAVPAAHADGFAEAVALCQAELGRTMPQTVLLPWRRDPHPDHRAASQIVHAALRQISMSARVLEYPIWAWERGEPDDAPRAGEARAFRLDIASVYDTKQQAIYAHQSQVTRLIDDDPHGFWLSPEVLAHFARPWEVYLEAAAP